MSVGQICVCDVDLADENETVWQAAARMHQRGVRSLVIVDEANEPIGILTDRDLVERVLAQSRDASATLVRDVMSANPQTISEEAPLESALTLMRGGSIRRLLVVDGERKLVGILSLEDILLLFAEEFRLIGGLIEHKTPRGIAEDWVPERQPR